jgi:hypothetical protein
LVHTTREEAVSLATTPLAGNRERPANSFAIILHNGVQCNSTNGLVPLPESYPLTRWCVHFGGNSADIVIPSEAKESPPCPEGIPSSLALLGMTGESDPTFPPKTIRYR